MGLGEWEVYSWSCMGVACQTTIAPLQIRHGARRVSTEQAGVSVGEAISSAGGLGFPIALVFVDGASSHTLYVGALLPDAVSQGEFCFSGGGGGGRGWAAEGRGVKTEVSQVPHGRWLGFLHAFALVTGGYS